MRSGGYLREGGFLQVERPPLLWEADTGWGPFVRLLDELLVLGLQRGSQPADLTLSVANVTVGRSAAGENLPAGDYVAVTVRGPGAWGPDARWWPGAASAGGLLAALVGPLRAARGRYAYARDLGREGGVTVCFGRPG
jgi:hypothetical protein